MRKYNPSDKSTNGHYSLCASPHWSQNWIELKLQKYSCTALMNMFPYYFLSYRMFKPTVQTNSISKLTSCISWFDSFLASPPDIIADSGLQCNQSMNKKIILPRHLHSRIFRHRSGHIWQKKQSTWHKETESAISHETQTELLLSIRKGRTVIIT